MNNSLTNSLTDLLTDQPLTDRLTNELSSGSFISSIWPFQAASSGVIRGAGKQKIGAVCNILGYYGVGLPVGLPLMFSAKLGIKGEFHKKDVSVFPLLLLQMIYVSLTTFVFFQVCGSACSPVCFCSPLFWFCSWSGWTGVQLWWRSDFLLTDVSASLSNDSSLLFFITNRLNAEQDSTPATQSPVRGAVKKLQLHIRHSVKTWLSVEIHEKWFQLSEKTEATVTDQKKVGWFRTKSWI